MPPSSGSFRRDLFPCPGISIPTRLIGDIVPGKDTTASSHLQKFLKIALVTNIIYLLILYNMNSIINDDVSKFFSGFW